MCLPAGSVLVLMVLALVGKISSAPSRNGIIFIAQCRARCLAKLLDSTADDQACFTNPLCESCWNACATISMSTYEEFWKDTCTRKKDLCNRGCRVACQFKKSPPRGISGGGNDWQFPQTPAAYPDSHFHDVFVAWTEPVLNNSIPDTSVAGNKDPYLVYVLLARKDKKHPWKQMIQTYSTTAKVGLYDLPYKPEFWLLAVDEHGTRTQVKFESQMDIPWKGEFEIPNKYPARVGDSGIISSSKDSTLNLTLETRIRKGRIYPTIRWTNPSVIPPRASSNGKLSYKLDFYRNNCDLPCTLPQDHFAETIHVNISQQPQVQLQKIVSNDEIVFNAQYTIKVKLDDQWKGNLEYHTPVCKDFEDGDPSVCLQENIDNSLVQLVDTTKATPSGHGMTDMENNEEIVYSTDDSSIGHAIDLNITVVEMLYDPDTEHVHVKLKWPPPVNQARTQEIIWANVDHKYVTDAGRKSLSGMSTKTTLVLKPNNEYRVVINASMTRENGKEVPIRSRTAVICTNITDTMGHVFASRISAAEKEKDILGGIILGVPVVASLIIVGIIVLFVYKKRQSFRDIMLTKTAVAKSNSYKSNVGCKGDYSNQMLITSDDWEIDCRQLKFASPIGQGAFGKVVTGYYKDQRVAIKLVRDCAPISYKEDLLAELNLMKRLGSHPNIVSMIGAVTLMEPICLVMEYAPYGNLQNFLKRCRLEGDLTVNGGKNPALNYSLMDEHGGINEGVITPADLLSFARQVSMAMEYLAVKKYVHRDLAARNVLLGNDKIIKVCDFGLSRDIYSDNQYKKLTNGKLPLKWMAIESLRDRVFTTQSDVWSFGILLWEIVTMGASPYPNIALADLYYLLSNHYRMEKPSNCSDELYIIMRQCWLDNPTDRPNFTDLRVQLEVLLSRDRNYLELDNINVPLSTPESSSGSPVSDDTASLLAAQALQPQKLPKDELTVDVCIHDKSPHDKSVERLLKRKGEFDSHNITIL